MMAKPIAEHSEYLAATPQFLAAESKQSLLQAELVVRIVVARGERSVRLADRHSMGLGGLAAL
jgi:hypothetical protein